MPNAEQVMGQATQVLDTEGNEIPWYEHRGQPVTNWSRAVIRGHASWDRREPDVWVTPETHQLIWEEEDDFGDYESDDLDTVWVLYVRPHQYMSPEAIAEREQAELAEEARQAALEADQSEWCRPWTERESHANPDAGESSNPDGAWGTSSGDGWMVD